MVAIERRELVTVERYGDGFGRRRTRWFVDHGRFLSD